MRLTKNLRRLIAASMMAGIFTFTPDICGFTPLPAAHAEVKQFEGEGRVVLSEFENINTAKQRALEYAKRSSVELIAVYIKSYLQVQNYNLTNDEIKDVAVAVSKFFNIRYVTTNNDKMIVRAMVSVNVDTENIMKWLEQHTEQQRADFFKQNRELQKKNEEQQKKINEQNKKLQEVRQITDNASVQTKEEEIHEKGTFQLGQRDNREDAQKAALLDAKRKIGERIGVTIRSYSKLKNGRLPEDEIELICQASFKVTNERVEFTENGLLCTVYVTAVKLDNKEIDNIIKYVSS